jgi:hypothetical protein
MICPVLSFCNPWLLYWLFAALSLLPLWRLFRRAGLKPYPALTVFIPLIGFAVALSCLGFPRWPSVPAKAKKKGRR